MYGYFRPGNSRLSKQEKQLFRSYYCRVCYCLQLLWGQSARFLTTYDIAIYSMILNIATGGETPPPVKCRVIGRKYRKQYIDDQIGMRLARLSLIVFGEKIRDDLADGEVLKGKSMALLYGKPIENACKAEPELAEIARKSLERLDEQQKDNASAEEVLETYGQMMEDLFSTFGIKEEKYLRLFRCLAKWTFYMDMLADYDEDYRTGNYNGYRMEGCSTIQECFDRNYLYFIRENRKINDEISDAMKQIDNHSKEWHVLNKMIGHATRTMALRLLVGDDIKFRFIRCGSPSNKSV